MGCAIAILFVKKLYIFWTGNSIGDLDRLMSASCPKISCALMHDSNALSDAVLSNSSNASRIFSISIDSDGNARKQGDAPHNAIPQPQPQPVLFDAAMQESKLPRHL
eukprot:CAMPEP_0201737442 /NCGR_PEP_ID=MMETSP0593-20130828/42407_1 /ASSEMBLY_ACC=CAM_ASM_000672 /TAXON_ID=267983 /ORGANISM="Skeletonema japonicum, Strain CCMP2506" /LENGTH=106 /DNA_ID=CAMNT_0048231421 /DNA_START=36 /DNA_END=356 /DNA_ORIENTATION=-